MFFCADPDAFPRNAAVVREVASQERVEDRTAEWVELRPTGHAAQVCWNRCEHARVLSNEGATERERADHKEESLMSTAIAPIPFAETPRARPRADFDRSLAAQHERAQKRRHPMRMCWNRSRAARVLINAGAAAAAR